MSFAAFTTPSQMPSEPFTKPDPKRFEVSRATLWFDRFMGWGIRFGGIAVILAVFGIFWFIGKEVMPLFKPGEVALAQTAESGARPLALGVDEWGELPFFYSGGETVVFVNGESGERSEMPVPGLEGMEVTSVSYDPVSRRVALGFADGRVGSFIVDYRRAFENGEAKGVVPEITAEPFFEIRNGEGPVTDIAYGDGGESRIIVAKRGSGDGRSIELLRLGMKGGLIGGKTLKLLSETDVSDQIEGEARIIATSPSI